MELKDYVTAGIAVIGFLITIALGGWNIFLAKNNRFISSINNERVKWINNVRELFSQFDKHAYLQSQMYEDILLKGASELKSTSTDIVYFNNHIQLYLNPSEIVSKVFMELQDKTTLLLLPDSTGSLNDLSIIEQNLMDLHYFRQVILKAEWKRVKEENKKGKEISDKRMNKIFIETAKKINEHDYDRLLKAKFDSN